jgi:AraC family transcriptional activator FtrA
MSPKPIRKKRGPHRIAAAVYDGLLSFEYSIAREILGRDRSDRIDNWFEFQPCRIERGRLFTSHGLEVRPDGDLSDLVTADTVLIAGWRDPEEAPPQPFLQALRAAAERGARLVSICTGAFPLAHAGLLDGRRATTHWMYAETLRSRFPNVQVDSDALYIRDASGPAPISTSAGCAAGLDLCLALIREDYGVAAANQVARRMVAPVHRDGGQSQYAEVDTVSETNDGFGPMLEWMIEHLEEPLALDEVAKEFGYSLRTFQRRFKEVTGSSPHQWLVQQRVTRARELLEAGDQSVEQIATLSGLGSSANLRKHLGRILGTTPRAYRAAFRASD